MWGNRLNGALEEINRPQRTGVGEKGGNKGKRGKENRRGGDTQHDLGKRAEGACHQEINKGWVGEID